jgi:hypothetical protein
VTPDRIKEVQLQLRRRAYDRREEFGAVLAWFVAEGLALRLAQHKVVRDQLLLSGDLMLHACLGGEAPYEWQAELLAVGPVDNDKLAQRLREACDVDVDDGLDIDLPGGGVSGQISSAGGSCAVVNLVGHLGGIKVPLSVVVRLDERISLKPSDYQLKSVLGGSLGARVLACSPTSLLGLRLRAAVALGASPAGVKVLWDLYRLVESGKVEVSLFPAAIADAFFARGLNTPKSVPLVLIDEFAADASREHVWAAFVKRARIAAPALGEVMQRVQREVWPWLVQGRDGASS